MTTQDTPRLYVWDTKTGVVISNTKIWSLGEILFSGNQHVVCLLDEGYRFCIYNAISGTRVHEGRLTQWPGHQLGAYWACENSLCFATGFRINGEFMINTQKHQLTPAYQYPVIESFPVPPHDGIFSFSPAPFHASFVTNTEVIILDVQSSKTLLQVKEAQSLYTPPGFFSPDGCFFACGTQELQICVWKNTSTGYVPWSNLKSRLPFKGFSFSPTMPSILTWDQEGIQLLHPDSHPNHPQHDNSPNHQQGDHLVAYSTDLVHIATAQQGGSCVMVFDTLLGTLQQYIDTSMRIMDVKIVGDGVFVADRGEVVSWHLTTGVRNKGTFFGGASVTNNTEHVVLSNDCSQIAFLTGDTVFLYDIKSQTTIGTHMVVGDILDIRFLPSKHELQLFRRITSPSQTVYQDVGMTMATYWSPPRVSFLENGWSWANLFSHGYYFGGESGQWVIDPRGIKLLWLPPNWRSKHWEDVRWNNNFLALVYNRPEPIIIQFYP